MVHLTVSKISRVMTCRTDGDPLAGLGGWDSITHCCQTHCGGLPNFGTPKCMHDEYIFNIFYIFY